MTTEIHIRPETKFDIERIEEITIAAFKDHPKSNHQEQLIISQLRNQNGLEVSLVAEINGQIVGHIAFSQVTINGEYLSWFGLAPVSIDPAYQNQGIGSKLIVSGLKAIQERNAQGCVLLGEPDYYSRFGFKSVDSLVLKGVPPVYFQSMLFEGECPAGNVEYHKAFSDNG